MVAMPTDILDALANWTGDTSDVGSHREKWPDMLRAIEVLEGEEGARIYGRGMGARI